MDINFNLNAKSIYEKEFKRSRTKGFSEEDVNDYLDLIIEDYMKIEKLLINLRELEIENQNLKIKMNALKNMDKEENTQFSNIDILKRLSKLELAVFGTKKEID